MASAARDTPMLQPSVKDTNLPVEVRLGFVKKVYGILVTMLGISFAIAAPFVFMKHDAIKFMNANPWIPIAAGVLLLLHQIVNIAMCFEACCGGGPCMRT